jgi:hypothetical protein
MDEAHSTNSLPQQQVSFHVPLPETFIQESGPQQAEAWPRWI